LTAVAYTGWTFSNWSGDLSGTTNPASVTIDGNKSVTAHFMQNEYTLTVTVSPAGGGTVTKNPDQATYHYGDVVQLTALPNASWVFSGWSDDLTGTTKPASLTMNGNKSVIANFTQNAYTLTVAVSPAGRGAVTKSPDQATYPYGTVVQLTAVPNPGWAFSGWSGALSGSANPTPLTMDSDKTVTAIFVCRVYLPLIANRVEVPLSASYGPGRYLVRPV
jgi:uncharacterized repeat protein (TIGR02543 family)